MKMKKDFKLEEDKDGTLIFGGKRKKKNKPLKTHKII